MSTLSTTSTSSAITNTSPTFDIFSHDLINYINRATIQEHLNCISDTIQQETKANDNEPLDEDRISDLICEYDICTYYESDRVFDWAYGYSQALRYFIDQGMVIDASQCTNSEMLATLVVQDIAMSVFCK